MSRTKRHKSQLRQCIEWGARRLGDERYLGHPGRDQKKETMHRERIAAKEELIRTLKDDIDI